MHAEKIKHSYEWSGFGVEDMSLGSLHQLQQQHIPACISYNFFDYRFTEHVHRRHNKGTLALPRSVRWQCFAKDFDYFTEAVKARHESHEFWRAVGDPIAAFAAEIAERTELEVRIASHPEFGVYHVGSVEWTSGRILPRLRLTSPQDACDMLTFNIVLATSKSQPRLVTYRPLPHLIVRNHRHLIDAEVKHIELRPGDLVVHNSHTPSEIACNDENDYVVILTLQGRIMENTLWLSS